MDNVYSILSINNKVQDAIDESKTNLFEDEIAAIQDSVQSVYKKVLEDKFKVHEGLMRNLEDSASMIFKDEIGDSITDFVNVYEDTYSLLKEIMSSVDSLEFPDLGRIEQSLNELLSINNEMSRKTSALADVETDQYNIEKSELKSIISDLLYLSTDPSKYQDYSIPGV